MQAVLAVAAPPVVWHRGGLAALVPSLLDQGELSSAPSVVWHCREVE